MTKAKKEPTVADCEAVLRTLEAKRAKLIERGAELPELRRGAAFAAHVEGKRTSR
jgi:hypothetical protein